MDAREFMKEIVTMSPGEGKVELDNNIKPDIA
jgi:hypothetical protein